MKFSRLLLIPVMLGGTMLSACGGSSNPIELKYGQTIKNDVDYITYADLASLFNTKQTFMVTVFTQTCSCWSTFHGILNTYISENHVKVYAVNYKEFISESGKSLDNFGLTIASGSTSFAIIDKGVIKQNLINGSNSIFTKSDSFKNYMKETVKLPKMYYVSLAQVDELYKTEETSLLYFARGNCSDCLYFNTYFLESYNFEKNLYILDCETIGIREYDEQGKLTPESQIKWNQFKVNYYLAEEKNPKFGYSVGAVPTVFLLKGNATTGVPDIQAGLVYFNDTIELNEQGKFVVTESYYTEARNANQPWITSVTGKKVIEGYQLSEEEISYYEQVYPYWNPEYAAKLHDPLAKAFLDYTKDKINHSGFKAK